MFKIIVSGFILLGLVACGSTQNTSQNLSPVNQNCNKAADRLISMGEASIYDAITIIGNKENAQCIDQKINVQCANERCTFKEKKYET